MLKFKHEIQSALSEGLYFIFIFNPVLLSSQVKWPNNSAQTVIIKTWKEINCSWPGGEV